MKETYYDILVDKFVLNDENFSSPEDAKEYLKNYSFPDDVKLYLRKTTIITNIEEL